MFIRANRRFKNGKLHTYYSVVESRRATNGQNVQRQVLYLGEISQTQEDSWQRALDEFNPQCRREETLDFFAAPQTISARDMRTLSLRLDQMRLRRPRTFGSCWLGCRLWSLLELDRFWDTRLAAAGRSGVAWQKVLQLLVVNRLVDPGSEFRLHRQWFTRSAMDELLQVDRAVAAKDRLYRCLDRILNHRQELFTHLQQRWKDLFSASFDVLLYDLTSTYFEGLCEQIPMAKHGYSRDGRPDCRQVVIALVVTPDGLPLAYEVMPGNTSDRTTLEGFLQKIEQLYGKARRTWVMDRGIPTEQTLATMRTRGIDYLVGTPQGRLSAMDKKLLDKPWQKVQQGIEVKLSQEPAELWVLARSHGRRDKEAAIRRKKLRQYFQGLLALRRSRPKRDVLLQRLGVLKHHAGRAAHLVDIQLPKAREPVTPATFQYRLKVEKFKQAERLDGHYLLRTNLQAQEPELLWQCYTQLTQIEAAFKNLKSDLKIRPIYHQLEPRVEAHIMVAFMAYCLTATLRIQTRRHAPGLTARAVLDQLAAIQMIDVHIPVSDGRCLVLPRYTEPEQEQQFLLDKLELTLPEQPPPRIYASQLAALQEDLETSEPQN
jgi:transposase